MIHDIKTENELRKLAGLPLKEAEGGSLDNIIAKHREAFESVMRGESMLFDHDEFYDELYEHYVSSGEMPYGVAKARDGDPDQWIQEELDREYGDDFATDDGEPMDGDFDSSMASAGMGTDEDYGYYGESKEPKTFREHLNKVIAESDSDPNETEEERDMRHRIGRAKKYEAERARKKSEKLASQSLNPMSSMALKAGKRITNWANAPEPETEYDKKARIDLEAEGRQKKDDDWYAYHGLKRRDAEGYNDSDVDKATRARRRKKAKAKEKWMKGTGLWGDRWNMDRRSKWGEMPGDDRRGENDGDNEIMGRRG